MIAFVNGIVEDYSEEAVILDVNGIGYEIKISGDTAAALPSIGERMKLYTYTYVREDAFCIERVFLHILKRPGFKSRTEE